MKHLIVLSLLLTLPLIACKSLNTYQKPDEVPENPGQKPHEVSEDPGQKADEVRKAVVSKLRKIAEWDSIKNDENKNDSKNENSVTYTFTKTYPSKKAAEDSCNRLATEVTNIISKRDFDRTITDCNQVESPVIISPFDKDGNIINPDSTQINPTPLPACCRSIIVTAPEPKISVTLRVNAQSDTLNMTLTLPKRPQ